MLFSVHATMRTVVVVNGATRRDIADGKSSAATMKVRFLYFYTLVEGLGATRQSSREGSRGDHAITRNQQTGGTANATQENGKSSINATRVSTTCVARVSTTCVA